uniref:Uncharacterized protein n=1 Tax=viral metagenome TaxID=1070528 RepID=A0A6C0KLF3_9ZZZZ
MQQNSSYVVPSYPQLNQPQPPNEKMTPNKNNLGIVTPKHLLFFSNLCQHSKSLLNEMNTKGMIQKVNLICIDNRIVKNNTTFIVLPNQQEMPLPPMINSVPTLCILPNHEILKGRKIIHYFEPVSKTLQDERSKMNKEPNPFSMNGDTTGSFGVSSDQFSFWDTNAEELSASGNGGTKQMYNYASVYGQEQEQIYTPPEQTTTNQPMSIEKLQQQRQNEI